MNMNILVPKTWVPARNGDFPQKEKKKKDVRILIKFQYFTDPK